MVSSRMFWVIAALMLTLAACGADSDDANTAASSEGTSAVEEPAFKAESPGLGIGDDSGDASSVVTGQVGLNLTERQVITTAFVRVHVEDVEEARDAIIGFAEQANGIVTGEQTQFGESPFSSIIMRIPPSELRPILNRLDSIGEVADQEVLSDDVTEVVVDLASREETVSVSVDRLRGFLENADTVTDIATLESELNRREVELESIRARLRTLEGQVALSTLTVTLTADAPPEISEDPTFVSAVKGGWRAMAGTGHVVSLSFGALLVWIPIAIVAFLVVRLAVNRTKRRNRPR